MMKNVSKQLSRAKQPNSLHLTERDQHVLIALARHGFLSGEQLRRLVLRCGESRARRRLRALFDHGFLVRVSLGPQAVGGLPPFVYELSRRGIGALRELNLAVCGAGLAEGGRRLVRHKYLVNEFYITSLEATRGTPYDIGDWRHEQQLKLPSRDGLGRTVKVPVTDTGLGGTREVSFLPDAFFELRWPGQSQAFFVEIDLATHALSVWRKRAHLYLAYHDPRAGLFRRQFGREAFRLLVVSTDDYRGRSRCNNILRTIHEAVGDTNLFLATPLSNITAGKIFLENIWRQPGGRECLSLLPKRTGGSTRVRTTRGDRPVVKVTPRPLSP